jgi:FkbM family methyltransferase
MMIPNPLLVNDSQLYWYPRTCAVAVDCFFGKYEPETTHYFEGSLHPGMVAVDLGASIGYYSLLFAKKVGDTGRVYAFEPQPSNCNVFRQSVHANGYDNIVTIVEKCVSDRPGLVTLHFTEAGDEGASLYGREEVSGRQLVVEAVTLDKFFESEGWPKVHVMKMDIEGAEKAALEGMRVLVAKNPYLKLVIEFHPEVQAAVGISPTEYFDTLIELGFSKFWALRKGLQAIDIPRDIPYFFQSGPINLLCER